MTLKKIGRLFRWIYEHTEGFLIFAFTIMLVVDVLLGILARYVHFEVVFATELGKYLFIWLCAIGIAAAARDKQHIRLDFFAESLRLPLRWTSLVSQMLFLLFSLFFTYWGAKLTLMHFRMDKSAMGFAFPMYLFTAAIPVGFFLTSLRLIIDLLSILKGGEKGDQPIPKT